MKDYKRVLRNLGTRQSQVFTELLCWSSGITASELAYEMHQVGYFLSPDRNNVHPRLNEMVALGLVEIMGKRQCRITNKTVAVYKVIEELGGAIYV